MKEILSFVKKNDIYKIDDIENFNGKEFFSKSFNRILEHG